MQIRHRAIGTGLVDPSGGRLQDLGPGCARGDGGGEEFPVGFCIEMAGVEGETVPLSDKVVPAGLEGVDVEGDEAGCIRVRGRGRVKRPLIARARGRIGCRGNWCALEVEAEEGIGVEVVQGGPGAVPVVGELGVSAVTGNAKVFPFGDVGRGNVLQAVSEPFFMSRIMEGTL